METNSKVARLCNSVNAVLVNKGTDEELMAWRYLEKLLAPFKTQAHPPTSTMRADKPRPKSPDFDKIKEYSLMAVNEYEVVTGLNADKELIVNLTIEEFKKSGNFSYPQTL